MKIKGLIDEDFVNYKRPSMFISTYKCSFKCDKECGQAVCQNLPLVSQPIIEVSNTDLIKRYLNNGISQAVVIGGLEPFDTFMDTFSFCMEFRAKCYDDIVIYTGYEPDEITDMISMIKSGIKHDLYIKFGRYVPNQNPHYDEVLGVNLASDNQKGVRIC